MGAVHTAAKRSPRSRDGTTITRSGGRMAAVTPRTIGCCSTRPATVKSITPAVQRVYRTLSQGCFERLEPDIRKRICPVLRGGGDGNAASLPDTMRLTVMQQTANSLPETTRDEEMTYEVRAPVVRSLERLKWFLWHGNVYQALQVIQTIEGDLEVVVATSSDSTARKLLKAVEEFHTYITNNAGFIPNYGERYRHGERISTGFVESTVNQVVSKRMVKKQQMQWSKRGARRVETGKRGVSCLHPRRRIGLPLNPGECVSSKSLSILRQITIVDLFVMKHNIPNSLSHIQSELCLIFLSGNSG